MSTERRVGAYQLLERIGKGGMGEVWRAEHHLLKRQAAVKLILPETLGYGPPDSTMTCLRRFEREARATSQLRSPHTVQIFDFGITEKNSFYYVMELLDGFSLESLVRHFGPVPPERAIHFLLQICDSLHEAHHIGLIHRDIKPANAFVCRLGFTLDVVKVLDFGLVKVTPEAASLVSTQITGDCLPAGSPAYMAPEIAQSKEVDARADIYALGCVAFWLLTGELVFEGRSIVQVIMEHIRKEPPLPSTRTNQPIPRALERLIMACLAKEPQDRPQSMKDLSQLLRQVPNPRPWTPARAERWWKIDHALENTLTPEEKLDTVQDLRLTSDVQVNPETSRAEAYFWAGMEREKAGDAQGAREQYSLAILNEPNAFQGFLGRGMLNWRQRRFSEAIVDLTRAIMVNQQLAQAFAVRGSCYLEQGDGRAALNDYNQAIRLAPERATLYVKRAQVNFDEGDFRTALIDLERAIELQPDLASAHYFKGLTIDKLGNEMEAVRCLRKAHELGHRQARAALHKRFVKL